MDLRKRRSVGWFSAIGAAVLAAGCANLGGDMPVSVNVSDLRMGTAGVFGQQYFVKLRIQNPTDRDLALKGVAFDLELNGKAFARGTSGQAVVVPRFGSALVDAEMLSTLTGVLRQLNSVAGGGEGRKSFDYRIQGRLYRSTGGSVAFSDQGELQLGAGAGAEGAPAPNGPEN